MFHEAARRFIENVGGGLIGLISGDVIVRLHKAMVRHTKIRVIQASTMDYMFGVCSMPF